MIATETLQPAPTEQTPVPVLHPQAEPRNTNFDLFRIILATLVLLAHAPELTDGNRSRELLSRLTGTQFTLGAVGVDGFFLLSGYLIVQSWLRKPDLLAFLRKRVLRIVPGYVVAALLSTVILGLLAPAAPHFFQNLGPRFVFSVARLGVPATPAVAPGLTHQVVNGSLWSIPYEFRCYLLVALFGVTGLLRRPSLWLLGGLLLFADAILPILQHPLYWRSHTLLGLIGEPQQFYRLTATYFAGGCFYLFRDFIPYRWYLALPAAALLSVLAAHPGTIEPAFVLCGGYLLFYCVQLPIRPLDRIQPFPDISYGIYLYGWPVEILIVWYFHPSPWITCFASILLCFALGWLSWTFVEHPMLQLDRTRAKSKFPTTTAKNPGSTLASAPAAVLPQA